MSLDRKTLLDAIKEAKSKSTKRKFLQSLELIINLRNIDLKKSENRIQELVELPHRSGKAKKICVFATGEVALTAKRAGADSIIDKEELQALMGNKKKQKELVGYYDFFLAEAALMPLIGKSLGATLGPRGKMPTPVPPSVDIVDQIEKHRKMVLLRMRNQPVLQCRVGDEDMEDLKILENIQAVVARIEGKLKGGLNNIGSVNLKTTMGSTVRVIV